MQIILSFNACMQYRYHRTDYTVHTHFSVPQTHPLAGRVCCGPEQPVAINEVITSFDQTEVRISFVEVLKNT